MSRRRKPQHFRRRADSGSTTWHTCLRTVVNREVYEQGKLGHHVTIETYEEIVRDMVARMPGMLDAHDWMEKNG